MPPPLVYLHGFASGPSAAKANHCRLWARERGIPFHAPDLNLPDFEHLLVTAQVDAVQALLTTLPEPPVVVGSSLGGLVGAAVARRGVPMARLILLAPAFGFARRRLAGRRWAGYRKRGTMPTFHEGEDKWITLGPDLLPDLPLWQDDHQWQLKVALAVIHGSRDETVPLAESEAFARRHPQATLTIVDDDHGLLAAPSLEALTALLTETYT